MVDETIINGDIAILNGSNSPSINGSRGNAELLINGVVQEYASTLNLTNTYFFEKWNTKYSGSYTRPLSMSVDDFESILKEADANVAPFYGARMVKNLALWSEDFSNAAWTKGNGGVTGTGTFLATAQYGYVRQFFTSVEGNTYRTSLQQSSVLSGTRNTGFGNYFGNSASPGNWDNIEVGFNGNIFSTDFLGRTGGGNVAVGVIDQNSSLWVSITTLGIMVEDTTGQANKNPSDHIPTTTAPVIKYYNNENFNREGATVVRDRIVRTFAKTISVIGDSQIAGADSFSYILNAVLDTTVSNEGVGSDTLAMIDTRFIADADPANQSYVLIQGGVNSVTAGGMTLLSMQTSMLSMISKTTTNGATPLLMNIAPASTYSGGWNQTWQDLLEAYNTWLSAYCLANGYQLFDVYTLLGDPTDSTALNPLYSIDGLHWNELGERFIYDQLIDPFFRTNNIREVLLTNTIGLAFDPATPSDYHFTNNNLIAASKGSIYIEYEAQPDYLTADGTVILSNGDCEIICEDDTDGISFTDGTNTTVGSVGVPSGVTKAVIVWDGTEVRITTANGTTTGTYAGNFGNATIYLGRNVAAQLYPGIISNVKFYYNAALSDTAASALLA